MTIFRGLCAGAGHVSIYMVINVLNARPLRRRGTCTIMAGYTYRPLDKALWLFVHMAEPQYQQTSF